MANTATFDDAPTDTVTFALKNPGTGEVILILLPETYIYNPTSWSGSLPTIWIQADITASIGVNRDSVVYSVIGDTNITYSGDYVKSGSGIVVPDIDCAVNINTGS